MQHYAKKLIRSTAGIFRKKIMKNLFLEICRRSYPYRWGTLCAATTLHFHHFKNRIFPSENPVENSILCNRTLCTVIVYTKIKIQLWKLHPNAICEKLVDSSLNAKKKTNKTTTTTTTKHLADCFFLNIVLTTVYCFSTNFIKIFNINDW